MRGRFACSTCSLALAQPTAHSPQPTQHAAHSTLPVPVLLTTPPCSLPPNARPRVCPTISPLRDNRAGSGHKTRTATLRERQQQQPCMIREHCRTHACSLHVATLGSQSSQRGTDNLSPCRSYLQPPGVRFRRWSGEVGLPLVSPACKSHPFRPARECATVTRSSMKHSGRLAGEMRQATAAGHLEASWPIPAESGASQQLPVHPRASQSIPERPSIPTLRI